MAYRTAIAWDDFLLELATVLLLHKSSLLIGGACFLYVRFQSGKSEGLGLMAMSFILLAIGSTIAGQGERQAFPLYAWTLSTFSLGQLAYSLFWIGLRRLSSGTPRRRDWLVLVYPAVLSAVAVLTDFHLVNLYRAVVFQSSAGLFMLAYAHTAIHDCRKERLPARYPLAASFGISALLHALVIVSLIAPERSPFDIADIFFPMILSQFAVALFALIFVKERAEARLTALLQTDPLTQIRNRHWFFQQLRPAPSIGDAFVIIDIDHFKRVNDTLGHAAGDEVLVRVAAEMSGRLQKQDAFARLGGEEFGLYLPARHGRSAQAVAEALRDAVQSLEINHADARIPVTISAGLATATPGQPMKDLMRAADMALYQAKRHGRNRVEQFDPDQAMTLPTVTDPPSFPAVGHAA
ncbi:GGDEF domain-containing protein [Agrobacterium sp. a22-2]|uniref:GGDEF domain-containing protein n=1 Tax=Agrobacterium sp. a22-2 TaxID=2283840 RepID=UPI0014486EC7|nr:GGDEF domain-containing protein [Agrobacterium sp. a22-2]NKN38337.1 GGDEF domain-containing protein [Agrobacterium sp. a22-2]